MFKLSGEKKPIIKNENVLQAIKFSLFSASAGAIQFGSFTLLTEFSGLPDWACHLISLVLSVLWNFTFNRKFTFKSATNVPIAMLKVAAYYAVFTPVSTWAHQAMVDAGVNEYVVEIIVMLVNFVTEFIYDKFVVFREPKDKAESSKSDDGE